MAKFIRCDGGCGAESPDPDNKLHVANDWFSVWTGEDEDRLQKRYQYCKNCAPLIKKALEPQK